MKNINFEFESKRQAEDFFRRYEGRSDIGADISGKVVEISAISVLRDTEFITNLFKNLMEVKGWQVCGPRCTGSVLHSEDNLVMLYSPVTDTWRCYQRGCGKLIPISETNLLSFREVQALFKQAHIQNAQEAGTKPAGVPALRKQQFIQQQQSSETVMALGLLQVHDEIVYPPNLINELNEKIVRLKESEEKLRLENQKFFDLRKTSDSMFRFLAGINFQDHSTKEQKEFMENMRELRLALNKLGIGSSD